MDDSILKMRFQIAAIGEDAWQEEVRHAMLIGVRAVLGDVYMSFIRV